MAIETRIDFADRFLAQRNGYVPDVRPWPADILTGDKPYPHEPELEALKHQELAERTRWVLTRDEIEFTADLAVSSGVQNETTDLVVAAIRSGSQALSIGDEINSSFHDLGVNKSTVTLWNSPVTINGARAAGAYYPSDKIIRISSPFPPKITTLISLARSGRLSAASETATHETAHAIQDFIGNGKMPPELQEAHSHRLRSVNHTEKPANVLKSDMVKFGGYSELDPRKISSAIWYVDRLNALGLSQLEIIRIISVPGEWDRSNGLWSTLDWVLTNIMLQKKLDNEGLERAVMARDLIRSTHMHIGARLAQEVLYDQFKDDINRRRENQDGDDRRRKQDVRIALRQLQS